MTKTIFKTINKIMGEGAPITQAKNKQKIKLKKVDKYTNKNYNKH